MSRARHVVFFVGLALIILLVSRIPQDVFDVTRAILLLTSGSLLLLLAASTLFRPARRLAGRLFAFDVPEGPALAIAGGAEWREMMRPLFTALVLLAVAGISTIVRAVA